MKNTEIWIVGSIIMGESIFIFKTLGGVGIYIGANVDVKSKTILELLFLVTTASSLFGIVRFTINIKKKLD